MADERTFYEDTLEAWRPALSKFLAAPEVDSVIERLRPHVADRALDLEMHLHLHLHLQDVADLQPATSSER